MLAHLHGEKAGEGIVRFKLPVKHARPLCHPVERCQVVVILLLPLKESVNQNMASDSHCSWVQSNACCSRQYIAGLLFPASLPCRSKDQEEASSTHATLEASELPSQEAPSITVMLSLRAHCSGQTLLEVLLQEGG